jgi:hypothetical protein
MTKAELVERASGELSTTPLWAASTASGQMATANVRSIGTAALAALGLDDLDAP